MSRESILNLGGFGEYVCRGEHLLPSKEGEPINVVEFHQMPPLSALCEDAWRDLQLMDSIRTLRTFPSSLESLEVARRTHSEHLVAWWRNKIAQVVAAAYVRQVPPGRSFKFPMVPESASFRLTPNWPYSGLHSLSVQTRRGPREEDSLIIGMRGQNIDYSTCPPRAFCRFTKEVVVGGVAIDEITSYQIVFRGNNMRFIQLEQGFSCDDQDKLPDDLRQLTSLRNKGSIDFSYT